MTLDRVLSRFGIASRTLARRAIAAGRLRVNGRVVRDADLWIHPDTDVVHLDGKRLRQARKIYLLFCKPKGVITSHGDPSARRTIYDYLDGNLPWVFPVGRLDMDSSGLLLLTNDTEFANFVTDPDSHVQKTYIVKLNGLIGDDGVAALAGGVRLKRGDLAQPVSVKRLEDRGKYSWLEIVLTEGKNREVRRMVEALGLTVLKLVRTRIGPWSLEHLETGRYRELSPAEIGRFRQRQSRIAFSHQPSAISDHH
jgi:23S rRNA pseudouridine2605 synthase